MERHVVDDIIEEKYRLQQEEEKQQQQQQKEKECVIGFDGECIELANNAPKLDHPISHNDSNLAKQQPPARLEEDKIF